MREIKFRVFDKNIPKDLHEVDGNIASGMIVNWDYVKQSSYLIDALNGKFPIMQYTGLKDKNGIEIFDGDIVKISGHPFQGSIDIDGNYEVGYNEYMELSCGGWYLFRMRHWAEVIGNKFENPELIKGADEDGKGN
ncbi:YopX family protein [Bacillus pseudomycoides]|uniref:YopX family protein n=1 Tax=Bacillus pseudomycoides TaxID=64104 RepID=UPI003CF334A1